MVSSKEFREHISILVGVVIPYALRAGEGVILASLFKMVMRGCRGKPNERKMQDIDSAPHGPSVLEVWGENVGGKEAFRHYCLGYGWSPAWALFVATMKLFFWHFIQPVFFWIAFYAYMDILNPLQTYFALAVAIREGYYFLFAISAVFSNPSFLIADLERTWKKDGLLPVACYCLAPEKYVWLAMVAPIPMDPKGAIAIMSLVFMSLFDVVGLCGILLSLAIGGLPLAIGLGYGVTSLGGFTLLLYSLVRALQGKKYSLDELFMIRRREFEQVLDKEEE